MTDFFNDPTPGTDNPVGDGGGSPQLEQTPEAIDLSDDSFVRIPGQQKPVKYGDHVKSLQSDYTRKTQEAAARQQALEAREKAWTSERQQQENYLKNLTAQLLEKANKGGGNQADPYEAIAKLPYLDGQTAANLLRAIQEKGFGTVTTAIRERDEVIKGLYNELHAMKNQFQTFQGSNATQQFESKISKWVSDGGYPPEAVDLAKEVYLAYEGDDLDNEFPQIFKARWEQLQSVFSGIQRKRVDDARRPKFPFAGKGGQGTAGKGIQPLKGNESAKQASDILWDLMQEDKT